MAPLLISAGMAISITPVTAQQAVTPPAAPAPAVEPVAPPPVVATLSPDSRPSGTSATPVNAEAAAQAAAEDAATRTERRAERRTAERSKARAAVRETQAAPAPRPAPTPTAAKAPAPTPASPPAAPAPQPAATAPETPAPAASPATETASTTTDTQKTTEGGGMPIWPWVLAVIAVVGAAAFFFNRRRQTAEEDVWADTAEPVETVAIVSPEAAPVRAAPVAAAPIAAATPAEPVVADDATLVDAAEEDVAALTATAPVSDRPWLEFAMRPLRAGTNVDEALVEIELTVGNAGQVAAEDVRISTFMLEKDSAGELERLLAYPASDAAVDPVTIAPGEGTRIDATLALLKANMAGGDFLPIVVADARYRMSDGSEGRTSASFQVGVAGDSAVLTPMDMTRPLMRDDVEARLYREPQHS